MGRLRRSKVSLAYTLYYTLVFPPSCFLSQWFTKKNVKVTKGCSNWWCGMMAVKAQLPWGLKYGFCPTWSNLDEIRVAPKGPLSGDFLVARQQTPLTVNRMCCGHPQQFQSPAFLGAKIAHSYSPRIMIWKKSIITFWRKTFTSRFLRHKDSSDANRDRKKHPSSIMQGSEVHIVLQSCKKKGLDLPKRPTELR